MPAFVAYVFVLGLIGALGILLATAGVGFIVQMAGFAVFFASMMRVVWMTEEPRWLVLPALAVFVAPLFLILGLQGDRPGPFDQPTGVTVARKVVSLPSRDFRCFAVFRYDVAGDTYTSFISAGYGCPRRLLVEYVVSNPHRVRAVSGAGRSGPPPPPVPEPSAPPPEASP